VNKQIFLVVFIFAACWTVHISNNLMDYGDRASKFYAVMNEENNCKIWPMAISGTELQIPLDYTILSFQIIRSGIAGSVSSHFYAAEQGQSLEFYC
jgi:hypothetical protein